MMGKGQVAGIHKILHKNLPSIAQIPYVCEEAPLWTISAGPERWGRGLGFGPAVLVGPDKEDTLQSEYSVTISCGTASAINLKQSW